MGSTSSSLEPTPVEILKNGLLAYLMLLEYPDSIFNSMDYKSPQFNGSKLPPYSGIDIANACLSYFSDGGPWKTNHSIAKLNAINRFVEKNIDTNEKANKLMRAFIKRVENKKISESY